LGLLSSGAALAGAGAEVLQVSMQKLNGIEWEPGDEVPEEIAAYDGKRIEISGFMRNGTVEGESWFDLTNDSCGCGTSKLQHFVRVTIEDDTVSYDPKELTLTGSFEVSEREDEDGFVESLYRLKIQKLGR
jgi:hypothetical protein